MSGETETTDPWRAIREVVDSLGITAPNAGGVIPVVVGNAEQLAALTTIAMSTPMMLAEIDRLSLIVQKVDEMAMAWILDGPGPRDRFTSINESRVRAAASVLVAVRKDATA